MSAKSKNPIWDILIILAAVIMICFLLVTLYFSFSYWKDNFPRTQPIDNIMFYTSIGIVIVTVLGQWIDGRVRIIVKCINNLKGGKK